PARGSRDIATSGLTATSRWRPERCAAPRGRSETTSPRRRANRLADTPSSETEASSLDRSHCDSFVRVNGVESRLEVEAIACRVVTAHRDQACDMPLTVRAREVHHEVDRERDRFANTCV